MMDLLLEKLITGIIEKGLGLDTGKVDMNFEKDGMKINIKCDNIKVTMNK